VRAAFHQLRADARLIAMHRLIEQYAAKEATALDQPAMIAAR
jgi:hypothetical protein